MESAGIPATKNIFLLNINGKKDPEGIKRRMSLDVSQQNMWNKNFWFKFLLSQR
jgi:hypothetical protein